MDDTFLDSLMDCIVMMHVHVVCNAMHAECATSFPDNLQRNE